MFLESFNKLIWGNWYQVVIFWIFFLKETFGICENFSIGSIFNKVDLRGELIKMFSLKITFSDGSYTLAFEVLLFHDLTKELIHGLSFHLFAIVSFAVIIFGMEQVIPWR